MSQFLFFWSAGPLKRANTRLLMWAVLALLATAPTLAGCSDDGARSAVQRSPKPAVRVVEVNPAPMRKTIDYVGGVQSADRVRVGPKVSGTLTELTVDEGDTVEAGEVVAKIGTPELHARLEAGKAERRRAKHERDYACDRYETDQSLADEGVIAGAQVDGTRKMCRSAREAVSAAEAKLRELRSRLGDNVVRAPTGGRVLRRMASEGEIVGPRRPLLIIGSHATEVSVPVVESDLERGIREGSNVHLELPGDVQLRGTVSELAPASNGPARTFDATIPLPDSVSVRPGSSVDVSFVVAETDSATAVPQGAVVRDEEGEFVFRIEDGKVQRQPVTRQLEAEGLVAVEPPLPEGARIAVTNLESLRDGMAVYAVDWKGGAQ